MIAVSDIRKRFGDTTALDGVSFEVASGMTFGLLGPNGAGKTTTISILCGLLKADAGTVSLAGQTDPTKPDVRMILGVVPQALALYEELSAERNLHFFGSMYGLVGKQLRQRIDTCLDVAGLAQRRRDRVSAFSGGMKRRLNMVCSLLHDPQVLLLDEPTVGVDPQSRNLIFDTIEAMKAENRTIIYTTHYMEEAERLCDQVAILDHGKVLDIDTVEQLIEKHGGPCHVEVVLDQSEQVRDTVAQHTAGNCVSLEGDTLHFETRQPMEDLAQLNRQGIHFQSLRVDTANLEDVFLNLTGRRLRD